MSASDVLVALARFPHGLTVKETAAEQGRSTSATRQTLKRLEKAGKVARKGSNWLAVLEKAPEIQPLSPVQWGDGFDAPLFIGPVQAKPLYVPAGGVEDLTKRIAKLAKRAAKLGLEAPTLTLGEAIVVVPNRKHPLGLPLPGRVFYPVVVTGTALVIAGWEFVAKIDHSIPGNLLAAVPTAELGENELARYRGADDYCDHCKCSRRRNDTFVVRSTGDESTVSEPKGTLYQVGRNCLKDFLGHEDPLALAKLAQYLSDSLSGCGDPDEEGYGGGGYAPSEFGIVDFLAACQGFIRQDGWLSRTKARGTGNESTANQAWDCCNDLSRGKTPKDLKNRSKEDWATYTAAAERSLKVGTEVLEEREAKDQLGDYEHNLLACLRAGAVSHKTAGFVGSLIGYVTRHEARELQRREFNNSWAPTAEGSEWIGEPKERLRGLTVKVLRTKWIDTDFGGVLIASLLTADGNLIVWFASGSKSSEFLEGSIGKSFVVDATVKEHKTNDRTAISYKETKVNRVTMKKALDA